MFDQGFHLLSRNELDVELSTIFRHWDASPNERAAFVGWAWTVAAASDLSATENRVQAAALLRQERDVLGRQLAVTLHEKSTIDLELVSRRMFLDWLQARLVAERAAA